MKEDKSGGVVGEGNCGDDVLVLLARDKRNSKKEAKLSASEMHA